MRQEDTLMRTLVDKKRHVVDRSAAADALGKPSGSIDQVWSVLCQVYQDPDDDPEIRIAVANALSRRNRALAPNQLCRYLEGDGDRRIRSHVAAILSQWGTVPNVQESALQRDLEASQRGTSSFPLANLAASYGGDPRVVATLKEASLHNDAEIRLVAQRGLGMLGLVAETLHSLHDDAPQVRASVAETLGYYGLKTPDEISALEATLEDAEPLVQRAARTALRRLGVKPTPKPGIRNVASTIPDSAFNWLPLLERWSRQWLNVREYITELPDEVIESGWLGYPGASEQQIHDLEQRFGRSLPGSYRSFLRLTNGWRRTSPFIEQLWSTAEVDYFHVRNQEWIDILIDVAPPVSAKEHSSYGDDQEVLTYRADHLREVVQISDVGDAAVYLLNPQVVASDGEWEAWFLASWAAGVRRYRSFWDLMQAEYASFVELTEPQE